MSKASKSEQAERINAALALIEQGSSPAETAQRLAARFGISRRQAYRYVQQARVSGQQVVIPERKMAFTVKLSDTLIQRLREYARSSGRSLSEIVTRALETFLSKR
jgi:DNA-binding transcriptional regulator LsrR (DeoR family)